MSKMASKRKQDEKHLNLLRGMAKLDHNKQCIDCSQRGPTYLNMTIGAFVCTSCSGLLRGLNPPHRVKSISMASFTPEEIEFVRSRGNEFCRKVWLGLHDSRNMDFLDKDENKIKDFMVLKYEKKRFYVAPTETMMEEARQQNTPPKVEPQNKPLRSLGNIPNLNVKNQAGQLSTSSARPVAISQTQNSTSVPQIPKSQSAQLSRPHTQQTAATPAAAAAAVKGGGINLLDELGGDPFTGATNQQQTGFADFGAFGAQPGPMPHSISQPTGFPPNNAMGPGMLSPMGTSHIAAPPTGGPVTQSNSFGAFSTPQPFAATAAPQQQQPQQPPAGTGSASDRYSALADLDSVFSGTTTAAPKTVNWDGSVGSSGGGSVFGGGSSTGGASVFGGTATNHTSSAPNPFGGTNTSQMNAAGPGMTANPFSAAGTGFGQTSYNQQAGTGFGQMSTATTSNNNMGGGGFGHYGGTNTTASHMGGQFGMPGGGLPNGNMATQPLQQQPHAQPPQQQQQMWGMAAPMQQPQPVAQGQQMNAFGGGGMNFGGGMMGGAAAGGYGVGKQQQHFQGQAPAPQQQFGGAGGGWGGAQQQPAANPFMNIASQQANRPLNSTNPFL